MSEEVGRWKTEDGRPVTEVGSWMTEDRRWETEKDMEIEDGSRKILQTYNLENQKP